MNPQPSECEYPPITTRPGLPPDICLLLSYILFGMRMRLINERLFARILAIDSTWKIFRLFAGKFVFLYVERGPE